MKPSAQIVLFRGKKIRKIIYQNEWWFSVVDICEVLTGSADAGAYWRKLKQRLIKEGSEVVTFCHGLKLEKDNKWWRVPRRKHHHYWLEVKNCQKGGFVQPKYFLIII